MKELYGALFIFIVWLYFNVKEIIYTHLPSFIIHASVYFVKRSLINFLALGIAAAGADEAAFLVDEQVAAVRALPGQVLG